MISFGHMLHIFLSNTIHIKTAFKVQITQLTARLTQLKKLANWQP